MIKQRIPVPLWAAVIAIGAQTPMTAFAKSPDFARTEEEWAGLNDNVLEYEELADLIEEYNTTVQSGQYEYNKFINDYGRTRDEVAASYRQLADDLESEMTGGEGSAMITDLQLELQADEMRRQADDTLDDSRIRYLSGCQTRDSLVQAAQSRFLTYHRNRLAQESAQAELREKEKNLELANLRQTLGLTTETDRYDAEEAIAQQKNTIESLRADTEHTRQTLIVMCGWDSASQTEITEAPRVDPAEIGAIDLEADQQTALEKNYTLQINQRKLENTQDQASREHLQNTIESNKRQIKASVSQACQALQTSAAAWDQALREAETAERDLAIAGQQAAIGSLSAAGYESAQITAEIKRTAEQIAALDLTEAMEAYRWSVNGLAAAE